ncbi:MAG: hypothetical protein IJI05_05265 [Erysipelotrichaceae bacterium]|nr:hypothetical protein [Erysipelotrichaceae bacterium]
MEIRYTNTQKEIADCLLFRRVNSTAFRDDVRRTKRMYYFMAGAVVLLSMIQIFMTRSMSDEETRVAIISQAFSMIMVGLISLGFSRLTPTMMRFFNRREIEKELKKNPVKPEETVINVDSRNFNWQQGKEKGTIKLTSEIWALEKDGIYYLDTRKNFFALPQRAFADEVQKEEFCHLMNLEARLQKTAEAVSRSKGGKK